MRDHYQDIVDAELLLAIIGPASADQAREFQNEFDLPFSVYVDPEGTLFKALGYAELTLRDIFKPGLAIRGFKALLGGARQAGVQGNDKQLPGSVIVDADGRIRMYQAGSDASDHLTASEYIAAVEQIKRIDRQSADAA